MPESMDKLLRVTQMNAIFLDNEIYKALLQIIQDTTKFLPPGLVAPYNPEINLIVKLFILSGSVVKNDGTFGHQLLSIKYENLTAFKKVLYVLGNCSEYVKERLEYWKPSHSINNKIHTIETILVLLNFINISIFLRNGVKPLLIERLLGLDQVYATGSAPRTYDSKYLARELLWNSFIELLVYVLPLINYHKMRRIMRNYNPFRRKLHYVVLNNRVMTMHSKCGYCGQNPILPHHMGCAHVFCYVCLKGNQVADSRYECPICEHRNPNVLCDRVSVM